MRRSLSLGFVLLMCVGFIAEPAMGQSWVPDTLGTYTLYGAVQTPQTEPAAEVQILIENWPDHPQTLTDSSGHFALSFQVQKEEYQYDMQLAVRVTPSDSQYRTSYVRIPVRDFHGGVKRIESVTLASKKQAPKYKPQSLQWFLQQRIDSLRTAIKTYPAKVDSLNQVIQQLQEQLSKVQTSPKVHTPSEQSMSAAKKKVQTEFEANKYVVKPGDSLSSIAAKPAIYGDASRWELIYTNNRSIIKSPDLIYPNQILVIPSIK